MSTTFPTTLQDLDATRGTVLQPLNNPSHVTHHTNEDDTIEALQTKVGIDSSAVITSLDYILKNTTGGHDHDGTDSKKVIATNLDVAGLTALGLLRANAGGTALESAGVAVSDLITATSTTTLTNKTLTAPVIATIVNTGTLTLPTSTDTLVGRATTDILTNKTLTAAKIVSGGFLADANGNEQIIFTTTASAVNEITVTNAATGGTPQVAATGGDTNIDILLRGKGTGSARHSGIYDGWIDANETWTYASASTITVPTGAASKYAVGDRIKWTQTTVKYGVIITVADTLLTIVVNTDHVVANAAISANFYSHEASPIGYPQWFNVTAPTFSGIDNGSGGQPTTSENRLAINGRTVFIHYRGNGTKVGSDTNINFVSSIYPATANSTDRTNLGLAYAQSPTDTPRIGNVIQITTSWYVTFQTTWTDNDTIANWSYQSMYEI